MFYGGGWDQLERQAVGAFAVLFYSAFVTLILALILKYTIGIRLSAEDESNGIDEAEHAETAYDFGLSPTGSVASHGSLVNSSYGLEERLDDKVEAEPK